MKIVPTEHSTKINVLKINNFKCIIKIYNFVKGISLRDLSFYMGYFENVFTLIWRG